ncbi:MAG: 2-C-methyl-D-erythritol 4-phosphate cytidylyltransferase [Chloroflexota bacterium]
MRVDLNPPSGSKPQGRVGAIVVAAGRSQRMGGIDKIFVPLGEKPLIAHSAGTFQSTSCIDQIVIVLSRRNLGVGRELAFDNWPKVSDVCLGGQRRQDSVKEGLKRLNGCHWIVIHDGARPFVTPDLVEQGLLAAQETGAAIAAVPVTDTIKQVDKDDFVQQTPPRKLLWAAQTPQVFRSDIIRDAYARARGGVTDDAMLVGKLGYKVKVYLGSYDNMKITTAHDLAWAESIEAKRRTAHRHRL